MNKLPYHIHDDDEQRYKVLERCSKSYTKFMCNKESNLISHDVFLRPYRIERSMTRVKKIFGNFEFIVIITIRNQIDIISSMVFHNFKVHRTPIDSALIMKAVRSEWVECGFPACFKLDSPYCPCFQITKPVPMPYFDYYSVIRNIEQIIGRSNVRVWPSEGVLKSRPKEIYRMANDLKVSYDAVERAMGNMDLMNSSSDRDANA